jgi:uncharacterized coiled-coil protein SlyX
MDTPADKRLDKLEEALSFQEHTIEQLDAQVRRCDGEIERLRKEVVHLEQRLVSYVQAEDGDD